MTRLHDQMQTPCRRIAPQQRRSNSRGSQGRDRNLRLVREYPVAIGQAGYETPAGVYGIDSKQLNPTWYVPDAEWAGELAGSVVPPGPDNPLKARWMGFNGAAGIHGTADAGSLGSAASHGCVRMAVPDVIDLYEHVPLGTPVRIE